jgi:hypothetical protein
MPVITALDLTEIALFGNSDEVIPKWCCGTLSRSLGTCPTNSLTGQGADIVMQSSAGTKMHGVSNHHYAGRGPATVKSF